MKAWLTTSAVCSLVKPSNLATTAEEATLTRMTWSERERWAPQTSNACQ